MILIAIGVRLTIRLPSPWKHQTDQTHQRQLQTRPAQLGDEAPRGEGSEELRQGRQADVQHLPAQRQLRGGRLPTRAVR